MATDPDTPWPQPDLRRLVCDAVNDLMSKPDVPADYRISSAIQPEQITIRCQRTWDNVTTANSRLNGGAFSACVAQFEDGDRLYSYFIEAARPVAQTDWSVTGLSGGELPPERRDQAGGFMLASGSHVCVGGIGQVPEGGTLRVTMPDGSTHESTVVDGCCIVFAPAISTGAADDYITVTRIDADGDVISEDRAWFGGGAPRPSAMPTAAESRYINLDDLSADARQVMEAATDLAQRMGTGYIGGEHILVALLRETDSLAARALNQRGVTQDTLREQMSRLYGEAQMPRFAVAHLSPRAERALDIARAEAKARGKGEAGPEYLLLGLAQSEGVVCGLFDSLGTSCEDIRNDLDAQLSA